MKNKDSHRRAPLYEACCSFIERNPAPFYCPGHKGGRSLEEEFIKKIAQLDLNNLPDTDTLHCPTQSILAAEQLLADAYGVHKSFILVGGSTLGIMASITAATRPAEKLLVQRNSHKSVIAAIIHSGAHPIWLTPVVDKFYRISHGLSAEQLSRACKAHEDAVAIALLNPTYYGSVPDIAALIQIAKSHNKITIVDEAHGAHFHFHKQLPLGAEACGADFTVQSAHKLLSALSPAAILHCSNEKIPETRTRKSLQLLQTTSPNFAVMASIDLARRQMVLHGEALWEKVLMLARYARQQLADIEGLAVLSSSDTLGSHSGFFHLDETKLLIDTSKWGISGYDFNAILNKRFNIQPEVTGPSHVLCIMSVGSTREDVDRLIAAIKAIEVDKNKFKTQHFSVLQQLSEGFLENFTPHMHMLPRDAFFAPSRNIPFADSLGHLSAEVVTPYPPGIPVLMPGERITQDVLDLLLAVRRENLPISAADVLLNTIEVVS